MPKSNIAFWMEKWSKNIKRDHRNEAAWREAGWNLIIVWQCALEGDKADRTLERICAKLETWTEKRAWAKLHRAAYRFELPQKRRRCK